MIPPQLTARYALQGFWLLLIAIVVLFSVGFGVYHKLLIDGYKFLFFETEGYRPAYERVSKDNVRILLAQEEAERLQRQINQAVEDGSRQTAERIDDENETELARQLASSREYIRNNRVRQAGALGCPRSTTPATAADHGTRVGEAQGATSQLDGPDYVVVLATDVTTCTVNTLQAEAGRAFALDVEARTAPKQ